MDDACLLSYLSKENCLFELKSRDRVAVLDELIRPLVQSEKIKNPTMLLNILKQREALGSTAIVKHVAIPHCRTLNTADTHVIVGLSKEGVDFNAPDNELVHLFFLVVAPPQEKENMYLPILGRICEVLHDKKKKKALLQIESYDELTGLLKG